MSEKKYKGRTRCFWQLLDGQKIEIPIIQRDYAQGREDKKEIRDNFLNALYDGLNEGKSIKLDFIYGSKENGPFQPLDGQQRLTTLFLLHWYAALKEKIPFETYSKQLSNFSYETRISSRDFCESLVKNQVVIDDSTMLKDAIIDSAWFFLSWKKDPTIDAMLRTIDDIHQKFCKVERIWEKLTSENSLVNFYHVDLEDIGLTDDLYIKMNARGKLLSPFENFKACFQKAINENNWENLADFKNTFACKIDTIWTDLFWNHRKQNSIDEAFTRFIATIAMIRKSIERAEDRFTVISMLQEIPDSVKTAMFNKDSCDYLCKCFDTYHKAIGSVDLKIEFPLFQHTPDDTIFSAIVYEGQKASYTQKVLFFAQTEFLIRNADFKKENFQDWMRVVRNIVSRGDVTKYGERPPIIRSPQTFDGVIALINELAEGSGDIYKFLASKNQLKSTFAKEQIEEEKLKANLICQNDSFKRVLFATEDTNLLLGRIDFALYCADYNCKDSFFNEKRLSDVQQIIAKYLSKEADINNDLRRALLTICDDNQKYEYYGYWWSFWNVASANKRCLIDKFRELEFYIYGKNCEEFRVYLKKLIVSLIDSNLEQIIERFDPPNDMPNWKIRLIKEPELLDKNSKSNYIAIPSDESCCYLLKGMRPRDLDGCERIE